MVSGTGEWPSSSMDVDSGGRPTFGGSAGQHSFRVVSTRLHFGRHLYCPNMDTTANYDCEICGEPIRAHRFRDTGPADQWEDRWRSTECRCCDNWRVGRGRYGRAA